MLLRILAAETIAAAALLVSGYGPAAAQEHKLHYAKDGSGVFGYKDTPLQPWSGFHVHDPDRPAPKKIEPGETSTPAAVGRAPSDAIVLFGGKDLSQWQPADWIVENGYAEAAKKPLVTKQEFGDCQLHLEWQAPDPPRGHIMNRGNNGVYFLGVYEVQIFDSYTVKIYPDGQAAAIYGQTPPRVNACRPPGQWQTYDIVFLAPRFKDGKLDQPARVTMLHNGVLVHHHQEVYGETAHLLLASYRSQKSKGPLTLGAHDNPVRFRNIWIRPL
jgi:hypothetical protein